MFNIYIYIYKLKNLYLHLTQICLLSSFICRYEDGKVGDQGVDTTQERFAKDIVAAMADCKAP